MAAYRRVGAAVKARPSERVRELLERKGFFAMGIDERLRKHEEAMKALEKVPRFNDEAAYRAIGKDREEG